MVSVNFADQEYRTAYQICDRYKDVIKDSFSQECLYKFATWSTIASADIESLPYGHGGHDSIEKKRCNLLALVNIRTLHGSKKNLTKKPE